jgi:anti-sigma B factor antagonist
MPQLFEDAAIELGKLCSMRVEQDSGSSTIRLYGEFGLGCAEQFQDALGHALDSGEHEPLVLDLRGLTFIDSTGLRILVSVNGTARSDGFGFAVLCSDDGSIRRVLRETGLDGILPVIDPSGAVPAADSPV